MQRANDLECLGLEGIAPSMPKSGIRRSGSLQIRLAEFGYQTDSNGMKTVDVDAAKTDLDALLGMVADGESVQLVKADKAVAKLVPAEKDADWNGSWKQLEEVWGPDAAPGQPASEIVKESRR